MITFIITQHECPIVSAVLQFQQRPRCFSLHPSLLVSSRVRLLVITRWSLGPVGLTGTGAGNHTRQPVPSPCLPALRWAVEQRGLRTKSVSVVCADGLRSAPPCGPQVRSGISGPASIRNSGVGPRSVHKPSGDVDARSRRRSAVVKTPANPRLEMGLTGFS